MLLALIYILGRLIFGGYFLFNAYNHLVKTNNLIGYAQMKGVPHAKIAVIGSGILLLIAGLSFIAGIYIVYGIIAALIFLIPVSIKMHAYWKIQDPMARMGDKVQFEKNMALIGALLIIWALVVPWTMAL